MTAPIIPRLGGGLGNRLFQYAAAAGFGERWGRPVCFSPEFIEKNVHGRPTVILHMFPDVECVDIDPAETESLVWDNEEVFTYRLPAEPQSAKPLVIKGYFQSERYFPSTGIRPNWVKALGPVRSILERRTGLLDEAARKSTWFIHFRFGDYKGNLMHTWNLETYYKKCLLALPTGVRLHVFSDEPHLCKEWLLETVAAYSVRAAITWSESKTDIEALYEMSLCQGGAIVANSTFSWWGAYFARANAGEGYRAYYPDAWGLGLPPPTDLIPSWGEVVATEWNPAQN